MGQLRYASLLWSIFRPAQQAYIRCIQSQSSLQVMHGPFYGRAMRTFSLSCFRPTLCSSIYIRQFSAVLEAEAHPVESEPVPEDAKESPEATVSDAGSTVFPAKPKKVKKERIPVEVSIPLVFERAKLVEQIVCVLKDGGWTQETETALQGLSVKYDSQLVTQVLRVHFPCDVSLGFFHWLKAQNGFEHTEYTYGVMLNTLGKGGHLKEMQQLFSEMQSESLTVTPVIISCMMHWYARAVDSSNVVYQWRKLKLEAKQPSLGIYTAYLDFLIRAKRFTKVPPVYERMLTEECLPNSRLYTLLIQHLADAGRLRAAVKILEIMQKLHVVPSRVAFEFIINGYLKEGNLDKVQEFLNEMRERFHKPSMRLVSAINAFEAAGKTKEASMLKEEIFSEDYGEAGGHEEAPSSESDEAGMSENILDSLMCEWRDASSPHSGFDVNAFAQALHTWNDKVEETLARANVLWKSSLVLEVLRRLRNIEISWPFFHWVKNKSGFKHDKYSCMVMIQRILKSRSPIDRTASLVDELFETMQKDGINFTVPMFNMMIRHFVLACDIVRAQDMFDRIKQFKLEPNAASFNVMIQAYAKDRQGKKAMDMLQLMEDAGYHPYSRTCAELITCLDLAEKLPSAYELFCRIPEMGRSPGPPEYKAIMAAYSRARDQNTALKIYEQMRGAGIKPTQDMFDEVSLVLRNANRQYDINTIANYRKKLKYFGGRKKAMQEDLLQVLDLFMRSMKPRPNNAYASARRSAENVDADSATISDLTEVHSVEADDSLPSAGDDLKGSVS